MAPASRIIIDTDPGVDDVMALLLAFAAAPEEVQVKLISVTFGNVDVQNCIRNVVSVFHHIEKEWEWRRRNGRPEGFDTIRAHKPIVAVGAVEPLADQILMADYFHGVDGLGGIHESHPHLTPEETWKDLFSKTPASAEARDMATNRRLFTPSALPAHEEMLRVLRDNEPDTITIVAIGPLTNLALAAAADAETFLRAKEVVVMGGVIDIAGNSRPPPLSKSTPPYSPRPPPHRLVKQPTTALRVLLNLRNQITPVAEFNTYADSIAAARVLALTSPNPSSTLPPAPPKPAHIVQADGAGPPPPYLGPYPDSLRGHGRRLRLTLFPLDVTERHTLTRGEFAAVLAPHAEAGSPLAEWMRAFLASTFAKIESLDSGAEGDAVALALHDPLTVFYVLTHPGAGVSPSAADWAFAAADGAEEDIRVETSGQWTRGMTVVDRRARKKMERPDDGEGGAVPGDTDNWLSSSLGNRVRRATGSGKEKEFGRILFERVFGVA